MTFSDWWTAFLAVASAAFAMYLTDNAWAKSHHFLVPTLWAVSACLLIICVFTLWRKRGRIPSAKVAVDQATHGNFSPSGAVGSIGSIGAGAHVNIGTSGDVKPIQSAARSTPDFDFVGLTRRDVFIDADPRRGVHRPTTDYEKAHAISVFTARFTNISQGVGTLADGFNVIAKLRFFSDNWVTHKDIEYAVWIGSAAECTDIDVGHTQEIFLFSKPEDETFSLLDQRNNSQYYSDWGGEIHYVEPVSIDGFSYVEIMLIDGRSHETKRWVRRFEIEALGSVKDHDAFPPKTAQRLPGPK